MKDYEKIYNRYRTKYIFGQVKVCSLFAISVIHELLIDTAILVTYIELVSLYNLGWGIIYVIMSLIVLVPFKTLSNTKTVIEYPS